MKKTKILFVCLGNICRSPMAEGVFRDLVSREGLENEIEIDSAGTGSWHIGKTPDPRGMRASAARGIDISGQRARQVKNGDFSYYDLILVMDHDNLQTLISLSAPEYHHKIHLFLDFAPASYETEVPDPYFGGTDGFEHVLNLIEAASRGLLLHIQAG